MNDRPQPQTAGAPAEATEKLDAAKIKRVDDLSALARTAWFTLLGALAFVAITLLSITHADVLVDNQMIDLPIVGVPVPTRLFLGLGPIALTVLYFNLHLYLLKLWQAFRYAPADKPAADDEPGWRLADRIQPWLVNDYALALKHDASPRDHHHAFIRSAICWLTVWAATPVVLGWMWCKSLLVREPAITAPILVCLGLVLVMGAHSWLDARRQLGSPARHRTRRVANGATAAVAGLMLVAGYATWVAFLPAYPPAPPTSAAADAGPAAVTRAGVGWFDLGQLDATLQRRLDISGEDVAGIKGTVAPFAAQREDYRQAWCGNAGVPLEVCANTAPVTDLATNALIVARQRHCVAEKVVGGLHAYRKCNAWFAALDRRFEADWLAERSQALAKVVRVELKHMRLSGMTARGANLTRVDFEGSDLSLAEMPYATLEEATLKGANLDGAVLHHGNLELANLTGVGGHLLNLEEAELVGASLLGADLSGAVLRGADLTGANLAGADLSGADLRWARLTRANLDGAILSGAKLEAVVGLRAKQLETAVGSPETIFGISNRIGDEGTLAEGELGVADCWAALPEAVERLKAGFETEKAAFPELGQRVAVYDAHLCEAGRAPVLVGTNVGRRLYLPESNFDRRVPEPDPWPPGEGREAPKLAFPWLVAEPEPGGAKTGG